ncbi:Proliferating cell nuclear antigen, PCNA [Monocercomonoides exilis]|uniref:Proliferating cell nuclear antigen, PCNA n=1 Tax=Monocercomonoides exilis TaxID=2049356 RepID=UPI0035599430|nr:Proliferating cell nuclear antigen, PCNA [Monocercomonoides exilis]KAH7824429.1 Proliferating cell nuclear antigen, PCNA [Monocercomonoides exilis]|eukprot:MONOS_4672.1-p1 / transcript=MONOS_4672.1 / gene=MONOS_4672 / organism=Monocercomonoides_exilis_PA203 / gene_product=Proliferating cell nuclear antigen, PCNA / transcript_product=Proliferating cell nuclear antigen, PCNA / location=Mono_scaffold00126:94781-95982(-) / protein_length=261 / sequence_SO=supercontig / SO=protein_coding / is_pseudo=false
MFEVVFAQTALLKKIVDAVRELNETVSLDISASGISLQTMDSSRVSLVTLLLRADSFGGTFKCDRSMTLGVNLKALTKLLKTAGNEDQTTLRAEDDASTLIIVIDSPKEGKVSSFELKLLDLNVEPLAVYDTDAKATVTMSSAEFSRICRDLGTIGDTVVIDAQKDGVSFSVTGDELSGNVTLRPSEAADDSESSVNLQIEEALQQSFALRFLNMFTKATPLSNTVILSLSPEQPFCVEYQIEDAGAIKYFLAPKIEDTE